MKILRLNHIEAKKYFMRRDSYVNFDLPEYYNFGNVLQLADNILNNNTLNSITRERRVPPTKKIKYDPKHYDDVSCIILDNKDGKNAWRPMTIMHPILYVNLVNIITEQNNWNKIQKHFEKHKDSHILCRSIPIVPRKNKYKEQILDWWNSFEQDSLRFMMQYRYMAKTDISNCYGSIYTHSIEWAMRGRSVIKDERKRNGKSSKSLGQDIDNAIRAMQCGQTNGIPQGSTLMDFVAEIVLAALDKDLARALGSKRKYKILRYRDDYRIFSNSLEDIEFILKELNGVLRLYGLALNSKKTSITDDLITESFKPDKWDLINGNLSLTTFSFDLDIMYDLKIMHKNLQKFLIQVYRYSRLFENTGQLKRLLNLFYSMLKNEKFSCNKAYPLISILTSIAYANPRIYPNYVAIVSVIIKDLKSYTQNQIINEILEKFRNVANTDFLEIWLQRIAHVAKLTFPFKSILCKVVNGDSRHHSIWCNTWLANKYSRRINACDIIDRQYLENLNPVVQTDEFDRFIRTYFS